MSPRPDDHEYPGLEAMANQLGEELKGRWPDVGSTVFLYHYGEGGGMAYVSTADRATMIEALVEWLARQAGLGHKEILLQAFKKHFHGAGE